MAKALLERYPSLAEHACNSGGATTFGERLCGALLPHAAEHLAIELLVSAYPGQVFSGATKQLDHDKGLMRVRVSLPDAPDAEGAAHKALTEAVTELNALLNEEDQESKERYPSTHPPNSNAG
jgi:hypothetical protein